MTDHIREDLPYKQYAPWKVKEQCETTLQMSLPEQDRGAAAKASQCRIFYNESSQNAIHNQIHSLCEADYAV